MFTSTHQIARALWSSGIRATPDGWRRRAGFTLVLLTAALHGPSLAADSVELSTGGTIDGETVRRPRHVIVEVDSGLQIALPDRADGGAGVVTSILESDDLDTYRKNVARAGQDAELNYELAIWTRTPKNLPGQTKAYRDFHLRRAIAANPDHAKARGALSYKKQDGRWVRQSDLMLERGLVRHNGRWITPEHMAAEKSADAADKASKQWTRELPRHIKMIVRGTAKSGEAWEFLKAIKDPLASRAIADQLIRSGNGSGAGGRNLRMLWIKKLGEFQTSTATAALVQVGLNDADQVVRESAMETLASYPFGASSAVATYLPMLRSNDNRQVNQAARALSWFPDPELANAYTEALVTKHRTITPPGAGMNVGFGGNGSGNSGGLGGLSTGGKATVTVREKQNPAVLGLLRAIEPEQNFGYDQQAWREFFAARKNAYRGSLRRDR